MQIVMRFAKRGDNDVETVRQKVITVRTCSTQHFNWHEAVAAAIYHAQDGERIVAVIMEGYQ